MNTNATATANRGPKPSRPLSAYNLFYRYKRTKILEAGTHGGRDALRKVLTTKPGLENYPPAAFQKLSPAVLDDLRRSNIRAALETQLLSKDTSQRRHRKGANGGFELTFLEMNTLMSGAWRTADDFTKSIFRGLAEEGRRLHKLRLEEYERAEREDRLCEAQAGPQEGQQAVASTVSQDSHATNTSVASQESQAMHGLASCRRVSTSSISSSLAKVPATNDTWEPLPFKVEDTLTTTAASSDDFQPPKHRRVTVHEDRQSPAFEKSMFTNAAIVTPPSTVKPGVTLNPVVVAFMANQGLLSNHPIFAGVPTHAAHRPSLPHHSGHGAPPDALEQNVSGEDFLEIAASLG